MSESLVFWNTYRGKSLVLILIWCSLCSHFMLLTYSNDTGNFLDLCWKTHFAFKKIIINEKYLNFRFGPDFEASCLTDTQAWLAYVPSVRNESAEGYTYISGCPISRPAEGLIYVFSWNQLTGTLVLQMGTGEAVRTISLQVTHQNDVRRAATRIMGFIRIRGKKAFAAAFSAPSGRLPCQYQRENTSATRQMTIQ